MSDITQKTQPALIGTCAANARKILKSSLKKGILNRLAEIKMRFHWLRKTLFIQFNEDEDWSPSHTKARQLGEGVSIMTDTSTNKTVGTIIDIQESEKRTMGEILISYIEDLQEGRKPVALELFKENPKLAETMAPLIHIVTLSMIATGSIKTTEMNNKESEELSEYLRTVAMADPD